MAFLLEWDHPKPPYTTDGAVKLWGKLKRFPYTQRRNEVRKFSPGDFLPGVEFSLPALYTNNPLYSFILEKAQLTDLPDITELERQMHDKLYAFSKIEMAMQETPPEFPDIPWPAPSIKGIPTHQGRKQEVKNIGPHPIFGIPSDAQNSIFTKGSFRYGSFDELMVRALYQENYAFGKNEHAKAQLNEIFEEILHEPIPAMDQQTIDRLRFLGLTTKEEFIEKTINALQERMIQKMYDFAMPQEQIQHYLDQLSEFINFAYLSDDLRTNPNRKTGETYFCHYLASAWLLWTTIEDDINSYDHLLDALEDVQIMFVHDIPEDFEERYKIEPVDGKEEKYTLTLQGLDTPVVLTRNQKLILAAMTKTAQDGKIWFQNILTINDPAKPTDTKNNLRLLRRACGCKILGDRLSNLFTMTAAGGTYLDVMRKLEETVRAGIPLLWKAHFSGKNPLEILDTLLEYHATDAYLEKLAAVPLLALKEQQVLMNAFGKRLFDTVMETPELWAREMKVIIQRQIDMKQPWRTRLEYLKRYYRIPEAFAKHIIPGQEFHKFFGLSHLANQTIHHRDKPMEFNHLYHEIQRVSDVSYWFDTYPGFLIGGVDDVYGMAGFINSDDEFYAFQKSMKRIHAEKL